MFGTVNRFWALKLEVSDDEFAATLDLGETLAESLWLSATPVT